MVEVAEATGATEDVQRLEPEASGSQSKADGTHSPPAQGIANA